MKTIIFILSMAAAVIGYASDTCKEGCTYKTCAKYDNTFVPPKCAEWAYKCDGCCNGTQKCSCDQASCTCVGHYKNVNCYTTGVANYTASDCKSGQLTCP